MLNDLVWDQTLVFQVAVALVLLLFIFFCALQHAFTTSTGGGRTQQLIHAN